MKLSEAVKGTRALAGKIYDYCTAELPKVHPNYPLVGPDDADVQPPHEEKELYDFLAGLSEDIFYRVVLLMYLGRGTIGINEMSSYFEELYSAFGDPSHSVLHVMNRASLADHLEFALEELNARKIDLDRLPLKKSKAQNS